MWREVILAKGSKGLIHWDCVWALGREGKGEKVCLGARRSAKEVCGVDGVLSRLPVGKEHWVVTEGLPYAVVWFSSTVKSQ